MQIWWWEALLSRGFIIANTHLGRENPIGRPCPKNLDLPSILPFLSSRFSSLLQGEVFCLFEDKYYTGQETDSELGFHYAYILTCVSV